MDFYKTLNTHYDHIFPLEKATLDFVLSHCSNGFKNILEIGCATGSLSIALAQKGYEVFAIDLNDGMMERAIAKAQQKQVAVNFKLQDMMKIKWFYPHESIDYAVCIGNTMAHVLDENDLTIFIDNLVKVLKYQGKFIFQIINYDRVLNRNITELPTIENEHIIFERHYSYDEVRKLIRFNTKLTVRETGSVVENRIFLNPITNRQINEVLKNSGFSSVHYYGGFDGNLFTEDSFLMIGVAAR